MRILHYSDYWYVCEGYINGEHVSGVGFTPFKALKDAFKDYQAIIKTK